MNDISNWTNEEINVFLTETVMKRKPVKPSEYIAKLKGKNAEYWRGVLERVFENSLDRYVLTEGDKPLKTHHSWTDPMPDFCENTAYCWQLVRKIAPNNSKTGFHLDFNGAKYSVEFRSWRHSDTPIDLISYYATNASMERAICEAIVIMLQNTQ